MKKAVTIILLFIFLFSFQIYSQEIIEASSNQNLKKLSLKDQNKLLKTNWLEDTLSYRYQGNFNTNFGFFGQEVIMQYFLAPADMVVSGIGFSCSDDEGILNGADLSVRLVKLNWDYDSLVSVNVPINIGYYSDSLMEGNYFGENNTGNWVDKTNGEYPLPPWTNNVDPAQNTWKYDLLENYPNGINISPTKSESTSLRYNWIDIDPDTIGQREVIAVVIKNNSTNIGEDRIGIWADNSVGVPFWKYYIENRLGEDERSNGWWVRNYTFDVALAVDFPSFPRIYISDITKLTMTTSTEERVVQAKISDDNPSGGIEFLEKVELLYKLESETKFHSIEMSHLGNQIFEAAIPGESAGNSINYKIRVIDLDSNYHDSQSFSYTIFKQESVELLIVYNGENGSRAEQLAPYYAGYGYDLWYGSPVESSILKNYYEVIEIHAEGGPLYNNREAFRELLNSNDKNLAVFAVIGQEELGHLNGFTDSTFKEGDYEYDILGVSKSFNNVNYLEHGDEELPTRVFPVEDSEICRDLFSYLNESSDTILNYYPTNILRGSSNFIDQFEPRSDIESEVFMMGESKNGDVRPIGHMYKLSGQYYYDIIISFMSFDPLSLVTADSNWIGNTYFAPHIQLQNLFVPPSVRKTDSEIPDNFKLEQNYPNPFNPTTIIEYSIPNSPVIASDAKQSSEITSVNSFPRNDNVKLIVYDILGREVTTLVNEKQTAGSYKVTFDASNISSGIYFYKLQTGQNILTKKMVLMK